MDDLSFSNLLTSGNSGYGVRVTFKHEIDDAENISCTGKISSIINYVSKQNILSEIKSYQLFLEKKISSNQEKIR